MLCFTSAVEVSDMSPIQYVRHVAGLYPVTIPHPPGGPYSTCSPFMRHK